MADEPDVAAKILSAMIRTYSQENSSTEGKQNPTVKIDDIRKYIDQIDKNNSIFNNNNKDAMKSVVSQLGDGPGSEYAKFQHLAPATLDKIRVIAE